VGPRAPARGAREASEPGATPPGAGRPPAPSAAGWFWDPTCRGRPDCSWSTCCFSRCWRCRRCRRRWYGTGKTVVTGAGCTAGPIIGVLDAGRVDISHLTVNGRSMMAGDPVYGIRYTDTDGDI
jgi:hypothetical protein